MNLTFLASPSNDFTVGPDGNFVLATGAAAVASDARAAMQAQRGEMPFAANRGVPTLATAWTRYNPTAFEAAGRVVLAGVPGVLGVEAFTVTREGETLRYTATIRTPYGRAAVNASL